MFNHPKELEIIRTHVMRPTWHFISLEGIICSGIDKGKEKTYALLEERIPPIKDLTKEKSLAKLAGK